MNKKDTSILFNINKFGPFFSDEDKKWLLLKPEKKSLKDIEIAWHIEPFESFLGKDFEKITTDEIERYCEITMNETHMNITPSANYKKVMDRIIKPIVLAKKYFTLGEYISCISMSGIAAEMMTLMIWKMSTFSIKGEIIENSEEEILFGKSFDRLGQYRRIALLKLIGAIQLEDKKMLEDIRKTRNKYTHAWNIPSREDEDNAKKVIKNTLILFKNISGMGLSIDESKKQKIKINPNFLKFLKLVQKN